MVRLSPRCGVKWGAAVPPKMGKARQMIDLSAPPAQIEYAELRSLNSAAAAPTGGSCAAAPSAKPAPPSQAAPKAIDAPAFIAALGINTHVSYFDTPYGDVAKVGDALLYLRLPRIRDYLAPSAKERYAALVQHGIKLNLFLPGKTDLDAYVDGLAKFQTSYPGAIVSLEGSNEVNYWPTPWPQAGGGKTDLPSQAALQRAYHDKLKSNPVLKDVPLANLTLGGVGADAHRQLGDMKSSADFANVHVYFGPGDPPRATWGYALGLGQVPMPGVPSVITETGYTTAYLHNEGVDETTQAKLSLNLLSRAAATGIRQTYLYELVDQKPDPSGRNKEAHFGLFRMDWAPKPAATAIRNFVGALSPEAAAPGRGPASLAYSVTGLPAQGSEVLFRLGDGRFAVVVWAEPDIWDQAAHKPIAAPASNATIRFASPVAGYEVFDPLRSDSPLAKGGPASEVRVEVSDHPVIVRVKSK